MALKALYQHDLRGELAAEALEGVCDAEGLPAPAPFARDLLEGCLSRRDELDKIIEDTAENWRLDRMPIVDRNILRLAAYELVFRDDTPPKVVINEAIEMAKKYSTENSATFVNGVLDKIYSLHAREGEKDESEEPAASDWLYGLLENWTPDPLAKADLHVHSSASDGSLSPEEIVHEASGAGLAAVALTDHDTVEGVAPAARVAEELGIRLIPGVELSAYVQEGASGEPVEMHLLGLFVDSTDSDFVEELERLQRIRLERIRSIGEKLRGLGVSFNTDEVFAQARGESVGRVHVARQLVRQGACATIKEAFDLYLAVDRPAYVPKERLTPEQAIRLLHRAGGCAVLGHPGQTAGAIEMLDELKRVGLDGVEVHYPSHSDENARRALDAAHRLGLAVSGGSDFHGEAKPDAVIGQESVSLVEVCDIVQRVRRRREMDAPA